MHAELAVDYFDLRASDTQTELLRQTVVAFQAALDIATQRFTAGVASDSDVALAQTQLETARSQLIDLGVMRAQLEHAIATLVGEAASTFALPANASQFAPPPFPPVSPHNCWNGDPTWRRRSARGGLQRRRGVGHRRILSRSDAVARRRLRIRGFCAMGERAQPFLGRRPALGWVRCSTVVCASRN